MAKINTLHDVFVTKLQALYDTEKVLEKALPKMQKAAKDPDLKEGFGTHLEETRGHIRRLEEAFAILDVVPKKLNVSGIRGIVEDGEWVIKTKAPGALSDLMLASSARYAEHFEIAGYKSAMSLAQSLDLGEATSLLQDTLIEEEEADKKLVQAMEKSIEMRNDDAPISEEALAEEDME